MKSSSFIDAKILSVYLDGRCTSSEKKRIEARLQSDADFAALSRELRQTRSLLGHMPKRTLPRNFTLKANMAGVRPPLPRAVPALSWASAVAMLVFVFSLGANLLGSFSPGVSAPMMAAAPANDARGMGGSEGGEVENTPVLESQSQLGTPTPETMLMTIQETPSMLTTQPEAPAASKSAGTSTHYWLIFWPALALLLIAAALTIRWRSKRMFIQNNNS